MADKVIVNADELTSITSNLESIINDLDAAYSSIQKINTTEYYIEGMAKGQVSIFTIADARMDELIAHYARLQEYVTYAGETFVEMDQSMGKDIAAKEK
ncbi:hypothetical protein [uncultured Enterococcus sp.]|uniref:hypothetical protein n=1 Tax=uncultured Enterococcus sp. TaxID=167972 RepID=UPI002AA7368F|nr:hypothetical protein [uncultured Enterococcus sp.]